MKLTSILLLAFCLQLSARSDGQTVTLFHKNAPIKRVLMDIQRQTGLSIFMDESLIRKAPRITINIRNEPIEKALDICLSNAGLEYQLRGGAIVVTKPTAPIQQLTEERPRPVVREIKGKVTDEEGAALSGATVAIRDNSFVTTTNDAGNFVIQGPDSTMVLVISYVGFQTKEVTVSPDTDFVTVTLKRADVKVDEVVVIGYGTKKRAHLTGAVEQVSGDEIAQRPGANIANSLQGLLPGLNIQANNGNPGAVPDINVRGFNSLNGGEPLIIIDGIQGNIDRINPLDVESITVLKDAASSAIYGARGAFGVILVTTKKGKEGKLQVNYINNFGLTTPTTRTDFISNPYDYGKTVDAALYGYNGTTYTGYTDADYEIIKQVAEGKIDPYWEQQPNGTYKFFGKTNWYRSLFRQWQPSYSHNLSISGGNEKLQGYLSGRVYRNKTIQNIDDAELKRYFVKGNLSFKATRWLNISYDMQLSNSEEIEFGGGRTSYGGLWSNTTWYFLFPFYPAEINGTPFDFFGSGAQGALKDQSNYIRERSEQLVNTFSARLTPLKSLEINFDYSNRINNVAASTRLNEYTYLSGNRIQPLRGGLNRLTEQRSRSSYDALNLYGTYSLALGSLHHFKVLAGYNQEKFDSDNILAEQGGLLASNLSSLNLGTDLLRATGSGGIWAVRGYFGRFNYDFDNKYLLEVNARYDGSSKFPEVSRWGFFPSVSAGWVMSREQFFSPVRKMMSTLKLRASYGELGNQNIANNTFSQLLATGLTSWLMNDGRANYAGVPAPLPRVVSWENSRTFNVGVDMGFFNDRLNVSFDWFEKYVEDMYLPGERLPAVFGAAEPRENIASLRNRGFELSIGYRNNFTVAGSPLRLKATASVYNFVGRITKYPNPNGLMSTFWEGQRLGDIYGYRIGGQFQSDEAAMEYQNSFTNPSTNLGQVYNYILNIVQNTEWKRLRAGDIQYLDLNGDGAINKGKNTLADHGDLVRIGNAMPRLPFGFSFSADWKNFDLSLAGTGIVRQDWYPTGDIYWGTYLRPYLSFIRKDLVANAWTPESPQNRYPQIYRGYDALGVQRSLWEVNDYYLLNVGYLRVKNVTIGYTFPEHLLRRTEIQKLRIYFSGENLFTWRFGKLTRYIDPEMAGAGINYSDPQSSTTRGTAQNYPIGRIFSAGINLTL